MPERDEEAPINVKPSPSWRRRMPLIVLALAMLTAAVFLRDQVSFELVREHRQALLAFRDAHYVWAMLGFLLAYLAVILLSLPAAVIASMTGGFLFGLFPGVFLNLLAATTGAMIVFLTVRVGLGDGIRRRLDTSNRTVRLITEALQTNEVPVLISLRLLPIMPFFMVNLLAAAFGVATARFFWTTALGIVPGGLVYTWVGVGLGEVFDRGETPNFGIIFEPHILGPLLGLVALALLPMAIKPWLRAARWR